MVSGNLEEMYRRAEERQETADDTAKVKTYSARDLTSVIFAIGERCAHSHCHFADIGSNLFKKHNDE